MNTENMEINNWVPIKPTLFEKIKCLFGIHAWEYYGTFNDEFNLDDMTNERICIFCNKHEIETDLENETWKRVK